jgi:exopolysaccharide production protein ExoQ
MIEILVTVACYLTFFANVGSIGTAVQVAALGLLFAAAAWAILLEKVNATPTSLTEVTLYAVGIGSAALGMFGTDTGPLTYSVGLLGAVILSSIVARSLSLERMLDIGAVVMLLCVLTSIVVERGNVMSTLSISVGRTGLLRFSPLGNHPNLTGYMFGAGSILMIRRIYISKSALERLVMAGAVLLSWAFTLAASARSSILALLVTGVLTLIVERRVRQVIGGKWIWMGIFAATVIGVVFSDKIVTYASQMLELDSSTRGVSSGGSGRVDIWWHGLQTLFDDPFLLIFGGGFRSSSSDVIGFSTESSYVTILLDSGIFIGGLVIFAFLSAPYRALRFSLAQPPQANTLILASAFLTFLMVQSIFNRYLLAVGNPISLLTLLVLFSVSMRGRSGTEEIEEESHEEGREEALSSWPPVDKSS